MGRKKKELKQLKELPLGAIALRRGASQKSYGQQRVAEMASTLDKAGLRDPIVVKQLPGRENHIVVMGGCRFLAAKKLGWKTISALLLDGSLAAEIKLLESLRDNQLSPWELADSLGQLRQRLDWTQAHLGQAIGKTRDFVANMLSISQIAPEIREFIQSQQDGAHLTARHLRYVARAPQHRQLSVAKRMLERELSTTALEREQLRSEPKPQDFRMSNLRGLRQAASSAYPSTVKEWKKYQRELATDIRRVERREALEQKRIQATISEARLRQRTVNQEARKVKKELQRELRRTRKLLEAGLV